MSQSFSQPVTSYPLPHFSLQTSYLTSQHWFSAIYQKKTVAIIYSEQKGPLYPEYIGPSENADDVREIIQQHLKVRSGEQILKKSAILFFRIGC